MKKNNDYFEDIREFYDMSKNYQERIEQEIASIKNNKLEIDIVFSMLNDLIVRDQHLLHLCDNINPQNRCFYYQTEKPLYPTETIELVNDILRDFFLIEIVRRPENFMYIANDESLLYCLNYILKCVKKNVDSDNLPDIEKIRREAFEEARKKRGKVKTVKKPKTNKDKGPGTKIVTFTQLFGDRIQMPAQTKCPDTTKIAPKQNEYDKSKIITLEDISKNLKKENQMKLGQICFRLTNMFRAQNNLQEQQWCSELFLIALNHSKDMACKRVPFGHKGFSRRCRMVTYHHKGFYENVAYCSYLDNDNKLCEEIVNGWINSPGHRKNMLANANLSAVAAFATEKSDIYYFTQLFALV